jgi:molecular chaperone GrpE
VTEGNGGAKDGDGAVDAASETTGLVAVEPEAPTPAEMQALRHERDDLRDQLLRKRAEFENFRKRVERDRAQAGSDAVAGLLQALIPGLDNLERALSTDANESALRKGIELIQREFRVVLEAQGVTVDDPTGRRFDPEIHQALSHEAAPGFEDGAIVEVFQKAYFHKGRLLRPALVKVAKGPEPSDGGDQDQEPVH